MKFLPLRRAATPLLLALLTACGGGAEPPAPPASPAVAAAPGRLERAVALGRTGRAAIEAATQAAGARARGIVPLYDVDTHRIEYLSSDADGRAVVASALVAVPIKPAGARAPVLGYQHGTTFVDAEAPSNRAVADELPLALASLGYVVVAPDYVGYGASKGAPHPYLIAEPTANAMLDALTAARTWRQRTGAADNGQLFLTGYSEGGYATLAALRAMQRSNSPHLAMLRAVTAGAGPYDVRLTLDLLLDRLRAEVPLLAPLLDPGVLRFLSDADRLRVRNAIVDRLRPDNGDVAFDYRVIDRYLADQAALLAAEHSVDDWAPALALRLFHGRDDQTVPFAASEDALATMRLRGAADVTLTACTAVPASHLGCVPEFLQFTLAEFAHHARDL